MTTTQLQQLWDARLPEYPLAVEQAELWLAIHTKETLAKGLNITFSKWDRDKDKMDGGYLLRYASKTMNNIKARAAMEAAFNAEVKP